MDSQKFSAALQVALHEAGVQVLGGERAVKQMGLDAAPSPRHEYGSNALTLELVRDMDEAIAHIHAFGSSHTEAIITGGHPFASQIALVTTPGWRLSGDGDNTGTQRCTCLL